MNKTLFELIFPHHIERFAARNGQYAADKYAHWANDHLLHLGRVLLVAVLLFVLIVLEMSGSLQGLSESFILPIILVITSVLELLGLDKIKSNTFDDETVAAQWKLSSVVVVIFSIGVSLSYVVALADLQDYSDLKKETVELDDIGFEVTIPREWSDASWDAFPEPGTHFPSYRFQVTDAQRIMWIYLYAWSCRPETEVTDFKPRFEQSSERYLDGGIIEIGFVDLCDRQVFRAIGNRKYYTDYTYIFYQTLHQGTLLCYTFAFDKSLDYQEQVEYADSMFENMKFTEVTVPDYVYKVPQLDGKDIMIHNTNQRRTKLQEDKRPDDYKVAEGTVDLFSAHMNFSLPATCKEVSWKEKTRSHYKFDVAMSGYDLECDVTVVWTAENAPLTEAMDSFLLFAEREFNAGIEMAPVLVRLNNIEVLRTAGVRENAPDEVMVRYCIYHKGARLLLTASISSDLNYMDEVSIIESFIENIDFY